MYVGIYRLSTYIAIATDGENTGLNKQQLVLVDGMFKMIFLEKYNKYSDPMINIPRNIWHAV